jgi:predicted GTPase
VVSIVGNTGEGKSYCLNRLFFGDLEDDVDREEVSI